MKRRLSVLCLAFLFAFMQRSGAQQTLIGFDTTFNFVTPASVLQGDTASFLVRIKNYGNFQTDSSLQVLSGIMGSGFLNSIAVEPTFPTLSNTILQPSDTVITRVITNYSASRFALGIDVVVIWPKAINAITTDSLIYSINVNPNAITEVLNDNGFKVFPNPFSNSITINTSNPVERINLYTASGQLIFSKSKTETINLSQLENAIYYLELKYKSGTRKRIKVMKQNTGGNN